MKRTNKKGFTIVELVVVIAVIAILAAIMIPTFSGVTQRAEEAARDEEAMNIYTQYLGNWDYQTNGEPAYDGFIKVDDYYYTLTDGKVDIDNENQTPPHSAYVDNGKGILVCGHADTTPHNLECDACGEAVECNDANCATHNQD